MKCPGHRDFYSGKQISPDYCIPRMNGDWYVINFDCLKNSCIKKLLTCVFTAQQIVQFNAAMVRMYLWLLSINLMWKRNSIFLKNTIIVCTLGEMWCPGAVDENGCQQAANCLPKDGKFILVNNYWKSINHYKSIFVLSVGCPKY